jgi:hypothetical protein
MTKGRVFGIIMAIVGGVIAWRSTGKKVESVKTEKVKATVLKCVKRDGGYSYDSDSNYLSYTSDRYTITIAYDGCRFTTTMTNPIAVGTDISAYMDITTYDDGSRHYKLISVFKEGE